MGPGSLRAMLAVGLCCVAAMVSCTPEPPEVEPSATCLTVSPSELVFDVAEAESEGRSTRSLTLASTCVGEVRILSLTVDPSDAGYEPRIGSWTLASGEQTTLEVRFGPVSSLGSDAVLQIDSNDDDQPRIEVPLSLGGALSPRVLVEPELLDFGAPWVGCPTTLAYTVTNVGGSDLVVDGVDVFTASVDFDLPPVSLPWTLAPGDSAALPLVYEPLDAFADDAYLTVHSNDPHQREVVVRATGTGQAWGDQLDRFEAPLVPGLDVLMTLDRSSSMADDLANTVANAHTFVAALAALDLDLHLAVVVEDDGCIAGPSVWIGSGATASEARRAFDDMAQVAEPGGDDTEKGFTLAWRALSATTPGDCNYGFYREEAALALVHLSDGPEASSAGWASFVTLFQGLKGSPEQVVVHAVAGDVPSGCGTADPGEGYQEAALATGGLFLSICDPSWSAGLERLADRLLIERRSYVLTELPVRQTIEVEVDGIRTTGGWSWDDGVNAVVFSEEAAPAPGSGVEVFYELLPPCG